LIPKAALIAVLVDPNYAGFSMESPEIEAAGRALGRQLLFVKAANESEFAAASQVSPRPAPAHYWLQAGPSSPANIGRSSRWWRAMASRRSTPSASTPKRVG
jgi:hypothetical protein